MSYSSTVFQSLRFDTVKRVPLPSFVVPAGSGNLSACFIDVMDLQVRSTRKLFLTLSALTALFWVGAWFTDGYGIKEEGMVLFIPPFLAIVFGILGISIKDEPIEKSRSSSSPSLTSTQNRSSRYQDLITIKELLDSGIITQEEYDEQKKQILND